MLSLARRRPAGSTLLELVVALGILALLASLTMSILATTNNCYANEVSIVTLEQHARWVLDRITDDVRGSVAGTHRIESAGPDPSLFFRPDVGYFAGAIQLGEEVTWQTRMFPGEADDGIDTNANGLVDERVLVRLQGGRLSPVSPWVREEGFQVAVADRTLTITLELEGRDGLGGTHRQTVSSQVRFRNP